MQVPVFVQAITDAEWLDLVQAFKDLIPTIETLECESHNQNPWSVVSQCQLTAAEITAKLEGSWRTADARSRDFAVIHAFVAALLAMITYDELEQRGGSGRLVFAKCLTPEQVLQEPHVVQSELLTVTKHEYGMIRLPRSSAQFSQTPTAARSMAPSLGQHTKSVIKHGF